MPSIFQNISVIGTWILGTIFAVITLSTSTRITPYFSTAFLNNLLLLKKLIMKPGPRMMSNSLEYYRKTYIFIATFIKRSPKKTIFFLSMTFMFPNSRYILIDFSNFSLIKCFWRFWWKFLFFRETFVIFNTHLFHMLYLYTNTSFLNGKIAHTQVNILSFFLWFDRF